MTRGAHKRWLTRIALVAMAGLVGVAVWLQWGTRARPADAPGPDETAGRAAAPGPADVQAADFTGWPFPNPPIFHTTGSLGPPDRNASLVVMEFLSDQPEWRTQVVRYHFKNGRAQPPEVLWEGPSHSSADRIIENRYLVSWSGSVIDLQEKTLIHEGAGRLAEVRGDRVVSVFRNDSGKLERPVAFNLRTRAIEKLTDREAEEFVQRDALRGERSLDGMKSITVSAANSLKLDQVGHQPKELGTFNCGDSPSFFLTFWLGLWLDNDRFLTQDGNGNLLVVGTDGVRVPVVQVAVKEKDAFQGWFQRDADGRIFYACGREQFLINPEAKTWERCDWKSLSHGFEESSDDQQRYVYRYKGTEMLRSPFWTRRGPNALATESYIAVCVGGSVFVWFAGTGEWTSLGKFASEIVEWVK